MFDFINITIIDILDILLVTYLIYQLFKLIRGTNAIYIFFGIIFLYLFWFLVKSLNMDLLSAILGQVLGVGVIALVVIFQQEIRRFLLHLGSQYIAKTKAGRLYKILIGGGQDREIDSSRIEEITQACSSMAETKTGALIVVSHKSSLEFIIETGDRIDAKLNRRLIQNIFFKNSPLHDGAMVITTERIVAARCTLPIVENPNLPPQYGMRHRAAVSISSETDADAIVVSEETGNISFVTGGKIRTMSSISELKLAIENSYKK
ncbi:MAG: diadenylate cyclase CdaA [Bacteroidales bacterium]|nr:diadenylate cyclase CdaA [Bacteroidales bacterium]